VEYNYVGVNVVQQFLTLLGVLALKKLQNLTQNYN